MPTLTTFGRHHIKLHRETHAKYATFGTHAHSYLHNAIRQLAATVAAQDRRHPTLLDYGCGKGTFIRDMERLGPFGKITGYDPAVDDYSTRPEGRFDIVTCLDVLDQAETRFVDAIIQDVAQLTSVAAVFSLISKQREKRPETNPALFNRAVAKHMSVSQMALRKSSALEIAQGAAFERAIIIAEPRK